MAIPVVSPYIALELNGAEAYYKSNRECVYDVMVSYEREQKKRVLFENDHFVAFCPFASRTAFEVWIVGKRQNPYFERITDEEKFSCAEALRETLQALYGGLHDPAYNFYIHSAPCDGREYPHYQWHIEILPHTATWAGFELSTGIEVCQIDPEVAAEHLRSHLISKTVSS
jgi:UDPglucose--hexose-1-phosphate uridylyltransferase